MQLSGFRLFLAALQVFLSHIVFDSDISDVSIYPSFQTRAVHSCERKLSFLQNKRFQNTEIQERQQFKFIATITQLLLFVIIVENVPKTNKYANNPKLI